MLNAFGEVIVKTMNKFVTFYMPFWEICFCTYFKTLYVSRFIVTYGIKGSTAGGSVSIAVMSEQLTPQLAV